MQVYIDLEMAHRGVFGYRVALVKKIAGLFHFNNGL